MKRGVRVILEVGPVPGTRGFSDPTKWRMKFRDEVFSWGKKRIPQLYSCQTVEELKNLSIFRIFYLESHSKYTDYKLGKTFRVTQKYIHEEEGQNYS